MTQISLNVAMDEPFTLARVDLDKSDNLQTLLDRFEQRYDKLHRAKPPARSLYLLLRPPLGVEWSINADISQLLADLDRDSCTELRPRLRSMSDFGFDLPPDRRLIHILIVRKAPSIPNPIVAASHALTPHHNLKIVRDALWGKPMPLKTEGNNAYLELDPLYGKVFKKLAPVPKLLIRKEYEEFLEYLIGRLKMNHREYSRVFLTGQPGIGTSLCLHYIFLHCLSECRPVFFMHTSTEMYYCDETGAYSAQEADIQRNRHTILPKLRAAWLLLDVDTPTWLPEPATWFDEPRIFAFASSPNHTRQRHLDKHFSALPWIMKPWLDDEILAACMFQSESIADVQRRRRYVGPVARGLFQNPVIVGDSTLAEDDREQNMRNLIENELTGSALSDTLSGARVFDFSSEVSHRIFLISPHIREDGTIYRRSSDVDFLSPQISDLAVAHLMERKGQLQAEWEALMCSHPASASVSGRILEATVKEYFQTSTRPFVLFPPRTSTPQTQVTIKSLLDDFTCDPPGRPETARPICFWPEAQNFPVVHGIILARTFVVALQMIVANQHVFDVDTLGKVVEGLERNGFACRKLPRHFVWIGTIESSVKRLVEKWQPVGSSARPSVAVTGYTFNIADFSLKAV